MNEWGRERTAAGLGKVERRLAGEGGLSPYFSSCLKRDVGAGGGCLLILTRVSYVF